MVTRLKSRWCLLTLALCMSGCGGKDSLSRIEETGVLNVITRNGPTTYYVDKGEPAGFEYQLVRLFAEELGVKLNIRSEFSVPAILQAMRRNQADLAAAALSITPKRQQEFLFSSPYYDIKPQIVYLTGSAKPRKLSDLSSGRLVMTAGSNHTETFAFLKELEPSLLWDEIPGAEPADLLEQVSSMNADYAVVNSNAFIANRSFYPRLRLGFSIDRKDQLAWLFPLGESSQRLSERANAFIQRISEDGTLAKLKENHFEHASSINPVGAQTFNRNMQRKLPEYENLIRQVADEYQLDWHLLAAIAYQESHWNPEARSPTGVRGMMMLTRNTAREMGVKNRLDALQSLQGGARYFKKIKRLLPSDIYEPDRTWFALAAYNIGRGHLEDARVITERQGGDPHLWKDVSQRLPLLQKQQFYKRTRYGYARGSEPVTYVKNIRHYHSILSWRDVQRERPRPPINTDELLPEALQMSKLSAL